MLRASQTLSLEVDGDMWCYQKPGFEAILLAELQRQQQRSQFCDTLLKAGGVSVPAHSCVLSAISPHLSSALSSLPAPPAGQSRLLEFGALGACALLHVVRLLYSGEMAGEGENEKWQAVHAAAKLGIGGLVEVNKGGSRGGGGGTEGQYKEVGVQTEETEGGRSRWRREVRDGSTYLCKETLSGGGKDIWTQTEEMQMAPPPPAHQAVPFETIDMGTFQSLGQAESQFVPITIVYPPSEDHTIHVSSAASACVQDAAGCAPAAAVAPPLPHYPRQTEPQSCWASPQGAGGDEEWEDEQIQQFEGNIAGFINYFLDPKTAQGPRGGRRRAGRRPRGARGAGTGQRRARRPRGRPPGRGRRGFTNRVDTQEAGAGELQKQFLHRWGVRTPRTGRGGGAIGRKLFLKDREVPQPARRGPRRRGRGKATEGSQSRDVAFRGEGGGGNTQQEQETPPEQVSLPVARDRRSRETPVSFPAPSKQIRCGPPLPAPSLSLSLTQGSPATTAASPILCITRLPPPPPPAPPPHQDQPEHIDRLLEEVMMGLDILPKNDDGGDAAAPPGCDRPGDSGAFSSPDSSQSQRQGQAADAGADVPVLQQQCEGELSEMLETFLQSFEQHVREDSETGDRGSSEAAPPHTQSESPHARRPQSKDTPRQDERPETSERPSNGSESRKASADRAASSEHAEKTERKARARRPKRRRGTQYLFWLEKKRVRRTVSSGPVSDRQVPEAEPQRGGPQPGQNCLQDKTRVSTAKSSRSGSSGKNHDEHWRTKTYPIRSRLREAPVADIAALLVAPLTSGRSKGRGGSRTNRERLGSSNGDTAAAPVHPQPADSRPAEDQSEANQEGNEDDGTAQPREEAERPTGSGQKRSSEDTSEEAATSKRVRSDGGTAGETLAPQREEAVDVETTSPTSLCRQGTKQEDEPFRKEGSAGGEVGSGGDEEIDVEGDEEDAETLRGDADHSRPAVSPARPAKGAGSNEEDSDEDIDVIGGSGPAPDPVVISWTESSENGEEDEGEDEGEDGGEEVDVVGERMDCISSFFFAAVRTNELGYGERQTKALSR
ncbi:uncharacterized protein LOC112450951 [Kryptolebias marmoratus]|uniref:uncharacterized protein LOC112450951 n=1 Tax=Kryptolebias marmoratus TaxID=37003 RepID=UPI000D52FD96|nr:uncharacterized protein LOC112450951 [Kryptolebias marmoratus]